MKTINWILTAIIVMGSGLANAQVAITSDGSPANNSAMLDVKSSSKGFLPPRMTTAQRDAISNPAEGLIIYNTDAKAVNVFNGVLWKSPGAGFSCGDQIMDVDSNLNNTVRIGDQCWMAKSLMVTKYNDGTAIPLVTDNSAWAALTTPAFCWYNNDSVTHADTYRALYNGYTADTGILCPTGWHVASDDEWKILEGTVDTQYGVGDPVWEGTDYRGHDAGKRLKSTSGWAGNPPGNGTDAFGFTAQAGGKRETNGTFYYKTITAYFWVATANYSWLWYRNVYYNEDKVYRNDANKRKGYSIRCLRD